MTAISNLLADVSSAVVENRFFKPALKYNLFLHERGELVEVGSARLQGNEATRRRLHGTERKPNFDENMIVTRIIHIESDSANLSYPYELSGAEDGLSNLCKIFTEEHYVWDGGVKVRVDAPIGKATLENSKIMVDLDVEIVVIDNDVLNKDDGKETAETVSLFLVRNYE